MPPSSAKLLRGVAERGEADHGGADHAGGDSVQHHAHVPSRFSDAVSMCQRKGAEQSGIRVADQPSRICNLSGRERHRHGLLFH
jgi:hypothetical protein